MKATRATRQKKIIESHVHNMKKLFSAEELLAEAKKEDKNIGIATVYRFLKEMSKKEKIHAYECSRRKIYSINASNHCHFECEKCGKIEHFNIKEISFLKNKINGEMCHFQINAYGLCSKCKNKNKD